GHRSGWFGRGTARSAWSGRVSSYGRLLSTTTVCHTSSSVRLGGPARRTASIVPRSALQPPSGSTSSPTTFSAEAIRQTSYGSALASSGNRSGCGVVVEAGRRTTRMSGEASSLTCRCAAGTGLPYGSREPPLSTVDHRLSYAWDRRYTIGPYALPSRGISHTPRPASAARSTARSALTNRSTQLASGSPSRTADHVQSG